MSRITRTLVRIRSTDPVKTLLAGYLLYSVIGWVALCLPMMTHDAAGDVSTLDHLFTAVSAVSTTGLVTVTTPEVYSFWGELVILLLIQLGGLGYMTFGSFVLLSARHRLSRHREALTREAFSLPEGFDPRRFIRQVVGFTLTVEFLGALGLFWAFHQAGVAERGAAMAGSSFTGVAHTAWQAIFHSVSAFCTAGFSLFPNSLETYADHVGINVIIMVLSLCGALGFIVLSDLWGSATGQRRRVTLTTRIIVKITAWVIGLGAVLYFLADPALASVPAEERILLACFQSVTAATTVGFNTFPIGELALSSVLLTYALMIIGASPAGTGGGLKSTSLSAILATIHAVLRGQSKVTWAGRVIPQHRLDAAVAALGFYVITLFIGGYCLLLTETRAPASATTAEAESPLAFADILFEAASALGTVGLSRGITGDLTDLGCLVVIALMYLGRCGPITFGLAMLASNETPDPQPEQQEDIAV